MLNNSKGLLCLGVILALILSVSIVLAAPKRDRGAKRGKDGYSRVQGNSQRDMSKMLKKRLGLSDEQWNSFEPKLKKVRELSRGLQRGGRIGKDGDGDGSDSEVKKASKELRDVLRNSAAKSEDISAKLSALRSAREKAKKDLEQAQNDLKAGLDVKQEAILVMMGLVE